jgi:hypothetical protein
VEELDYWGETQTFPNEGLGVHDAFGNKGEYYARTPGFPTINKEIVSASYDGASLRIQVKYQYPGNTSGPFVHPGLVLHTIEIDEPASPQYNLPAATVNLTQNWLTAPHGVGAPARLSHYGSFPPGGIIQELADPNANNLAKRHFPHGGYYMAWYKDVTRYSPDSFADVGLFILEQTGLEIYFDTLEAAEFTSIVDIADHACGFRSAYGGQQYCGMIDPAGGTYGSWLTEAPNAIASVYPGGIVGTFGADQRGESHQRYLKCRGSEFPLGTHLYPDGAVFQGRFICA